MTRLREVARLFLRLGFTAFGGPAVHIALMEDEAVTRRGWLDRRTFLDLVATLNFIPGPNSTELAIHLGLIRAGFAGLVVAGVCFISPAVLIILPLAWLYVTYGALPQTQHVLAGVSACVVAIVAVALVRFTKTAIRDVFGAILAIVSAIVGLFAPRIGLPQAELVILAGAALLGILYYARPRVDRLPLLALVPTTAWPDLARMALFFLKVGATLFGSGYVLVSYLEGGLVEGHHWLTHRELLDAIAVGQVTPGPLLTTATFVGYVLGARNFHGGVGGGIVGAILATIAIFLPSFIFIALLGKWLPKLRTNRYAAAALDGMNAAVVALIFVVTVKLAMSALRDPISIGVACATLIALLLWNVNSTWLILCSALIGWAFHS